MSNSNVLSNQNLFQISFVLSRVMTSGVIMSIEKNETELKGLEKILSQICQKQFASLFNCCTGAIHAALCGQDIVYGCSTNINKLSDKKKRFIKWLGIDNDDINFKEPFSEIEINWDNLPKIDEFILREANKKILILDFTSLGFGPAAALLTNDEYVYKKAERLKIFGAFDMRTMWTQIESEKDVKTGVQFNYRLSPLVGACIKLAILRRNISI